MTSLSQLQRFQKRIDDFTKKHAPEALLQFQVKLVISFLTGVVRKTRHDKGRARGGWVVTVGRPSTATKRKNDKNGSNTIREGSLRALSAGHFKTIFVTNNVEYILFLNDGTEHFEGDFMIERSLAELSTVFP